MVKCEGCSLVMEIMTKARRTRAEKRQDAEEEEDLLVPQPEGTAGLAEWRRMVRQRMKEEKAAGNAEKAKQLAVETAFITEWKAALGATHHLHDQYFRGSFWHLAPPLTCFGSGCVDRNAAFHPFGMALIHERGGYEASRVGMAGQIGHVLLKKRTGGRLGIDTEAHRRLRPAREVAHWPDAAPLLLALLQDGHGLAQIVGHQNGADIE